MSGRSEARMGMSEQAVTGEKIITPETTVVGEGPKRSARGTRDMVLSMAVLLIPIAIVVAIFRFYGGENVVVVDPAPTFASARAADLFPVAEPGGLSADWRVLSAVFDRQTGAVLRVGYLTPAGDGAQLIETNEPTDTVIPRELGDAPKRAAPVTEGGRTWQVFQLSKGARALVAVEPGRTIVVLGDADLTELRVLAAALR